MQTVKNIIDHVPGRRTLLQLFTLCTPTAPSTYPTLPPMCYCTPTQPNPTASRHGKNYALIPHFVSFSEIQGYNHNYIRSQRYVLVAAMLTSTVCSCSLLTLLQRTLILLRVRDDCTEHCLPRANAVDHTFET